MSQVNFEAVEEVLDSINGGITNSGQEILEACAEEPRRPNELYTDLGLGKSTVTRNLSYLQSHGMLEKQRGDNTRAVYATRNYFLD